MRFVDADDWLTSTQAADLSSMTILTKILKICLGDLTELLVMAVRISVNLRKR